MLKATIWTYLQGYGVLLSVELKRQTYPFPGLCDRVYFVIFFFLLFGQHLLFRCFKVSDIPTTMLFAQKALLQFLFRILLAFTELLKAVQRQPR